ncbi:hypothetical protein [uncultured Fusobacterium sp.]|uniref:hypothetical protein n=1 Tax=uncultured Fusobacterium sp. TaxID=159267 RepID=UPI0025E8415E|nr:hypothetical protein [uncultured Fusobacterium sp.]
MTDFFKRNRKKLIFVTFLFLFFFGGWWTIKYNLPKTVEVVVRLFVGPTLKSSSIDFQKDKVVIKDFLLADGEEVIIDTPEVDILYTRESLKNFRIEEIILNGGTANITRRKNGDINIVAAFAGESKEDESKEETPAKDEPYKPGIGIPIDRITGKNITTVFRDLGYRLPIEQTAYNTNGYLTFSKTEGINLHFIGSNGPEIYDFAFSTTKEPYSMTIKLSNIAVKSELVQYGYDGKEVSYDGGELNMDLTIASSGMLGWIKFQDVDVRYIDLDDPIKAVTGGVDFTKEGIFLNATGKVFGKPEKFTLSYKDNELNIDFNLKDIQKENLKKLSYLKGIELPFEKINIDSVKFNLNLKEELKVTIDAFIKKLEMPGLRLENTDVNFLYDKLGIHLPKISTTLNRLDENKRVTIAEKIDGTVNFWEGKGDLTLDIKNVNHQKYIPDFKGKLNFEILEKEIDFNLSSNIIDLEGRYLLEAKKVQLDKKNEYFLEYDLNKNILSTGEGKIKFSLFTNNFIIDYTVNNNQLNLKSFSLIGDSGKELELSGDIDLSNINYNLKLDSKNLHFKEFLGEEEGELRGTFTGYIQGEKDKVKGELDITSISGKYFGKIDDLRGKLVFSKDEKLFMEFNGEIGKLGYKDYEVDGFYFVTRMKNNIFEIKSFNNQLLSLWGNINLNKETIDLNAKIEKLSSKKFGVEKPELRIDLLTAQLKGKLSNPIGKIQLDDVKLVLENGEMVAVTGDINYLNNYVTINEVKINNNILKGKYSVEKNSYDATLYLIEENIGRYYGDTSLKYRVIGTAKLKGEGKALTLGLKSTIDKIYLMGNKLPNIYIDTEYRAENLNDGLLKIKEITLSNSSLENLFSIVGEFDVVNSNLNMRIDNQKLPLKYLKEYIPLDDLSGDLLLNGDFGGKLDSLNYNLSITSDTIGIKNVLFNKFRIFLNGDLKKVVLNEFSFKYLDNLFYSNGEYDIVNSRYGYNAQARDINFDFLNIFLEKYGITNIHGFSTFDLKITESKNSGFLKIKNFNLENKDLFLKLEQFNSTIRLENDKVYVEEFKGKLNEGTISLDGDIVIPVLKEISENPYYAERLKYRFNLKLDKINYKYGNMFGVTFNSNMSVIENKIFGDIEIIEGRVDEIPNTSKSLFQRIKEFLFKSSSETINKSEDLGSDFKIETVFENSLDINIGVKISKGIKLDIQTVNSFVGDVKGNVIGNGTLSGKDGKYSFIGNVEVIGGSLNINENIFYLDRAMVIFNDPKTYLPKVNPNLLVDARVDVQDEQLGLSLNGNLDNLQFTINSKSGSSSGNLNSLLTDTDNLEGGNSATTTLITNVIGGQLSQIFRPVSNLVKNTLNISKFRISSNILSEQTKDNNNDEAQSRLKLGAVLEAEDNIYKDKVWWVARGTLLGEDNVNSEQRDSSNSGALQEYDISLEYRFDATKSIGIGVGKLPEDRKKSSDKESKNGLNYHIDFKFEKRYDSLLDIFINK